MPSRVIRGGFNTSESMGERSVGAQLLFVKLILAGDDYGRTDARPKILKGLVYSTCESVASSDVAGWLEELATGDDPPVLIYAVDGKPYLQLVNCEKHRGNSKRGGKSRWPDPHESPGIPTEAQGEPKGSARGSGVAGSRGSEVAGKEHDTHPLVAGEPPTEGRLNSRVKVTDPTVTRALSDLMSRGIRHVRPNATIPVRLDPWDRQLDLMIRLDRHSPEHLEAMIRWLYTKNQRRESPFVVFSPKSLRAKYDNIATAINLEQAPARRRAAEEKREADAREARLQDQRAPTGEAAVLVDGLVGKMGGIS